MRDYFKNAARLIGVKIAFILITVFFAYAFMWLINLNNGFLYYSLIVCAFYFQWLYTDSYQLAGKDMRAKRGRLIKGFLYGGLSEVVSVIILVVTLLSGKALFVYVIWQAPYIGFLLRKVPYFENITLNIWYFIVLLFVPLLTGLGYAFGIKKISIPQKIASLKKCGKAEK